MKFELFVAFRYLLARRQQAFISLISLISALGIAVGVIALLVAMALMTGLQDELRVRLVGSTPHILVSKTSGIRDAAADVRQLRALPQVVGAAPVVLGQGLVHASGGENAPIQIHGVLPEFERSVTNVSQSMQAGSFDALAARGDGPPSIVIGRDLAEQLSASVGDVVRLVTAEERLTPFGTMPRTRQVTIVGVFKVGLPDVDGAYGFVHLDLARVLLNKDGPDAIAVRVRDAFEARTIAAAIPRRLGADYTARDWTAANGSLFSALWMEKVAISIAIGLIVLVAALNIIASLILLVMEKRRDIAILRTMGSSRSSIRRIFVLQGLTIGLAGTFGGAVVGLTLIYVLDHFQLIHVPLDVYEIAYMPFRLRPVDGMVVIVVALLTSLAATIYPSKQASRVDPARAVRE